MGYKKRKRSSNLKKLNSHDGVVVPLFSPTPLTPDEELEREELEQQVENSFYIAGIALQQLRDRRLYRSTHSTFAQYCQERFAFNRSRSYQYIDAAIVVDNLRQSSQNIDVFPTREAQVRPITPLSPSQQVEAWTQAVAIAGGKVPTARIVKEVARQYREPVPNSFTEGEVCVLLTKDNPELRGKNGCWCIVDQVYDNSCLVCTWDNEYHVEPENLESCHYSPSECSNLFDIGERMSNLHQTGKLAPAAYWILEGLGKLDRPYLEPLEEKLLQFLEQEYVDVDFLE